MEDLAEVDPNTTVYDNPAYDPDDADQEEEEEVDRTWQPIEEEQEEIQRKWQQQQQQQQGATGSDHGAKSHEMANLGPEQSGISDTTPLLAQIDRERAWNTITRLYPDASATDLEAFYHPTTKRLMIKMAGTGKKAYQ